MRIESLALVARTALIVVVCTISSDAQSPEPASGDWPFWRGPHRNGTAEAGQQPPVEWSDTHNVAWKAAVPGRGHSSPTVVGNRVLLTTAEGDTQRQSVLCYDRATGELLWRRTVNEGGLPRKIHTRNTHASSTISAHGGRLFAAFNHHDAIHVVALDMEGEILWTAEAGSFLPQQYKYGYAASPVLYGGAVIVAGDHDRDAFLAAFDQETGRLLWKTQRPDLLNWASPVVAKVAGRDQLLISGCERVSSYDPKTGQMLWQTAATTMATSGTIVWQDDLVFAAGGFPKPGVFCLRADGSGELLWRNKERIYEQSMLVHDGHLYAITDSGRAFCWQGETGDVQWSERLRGSVSASPVLAGGNIYISNERGMIWVFRATPEKFQLIAQNQLGAEAFATPSICGNEIFLRVADRAGLISRKRQEWLYCIKE
ncbi:MAG: PQQ-binding-like beta-propeller repeat protein [Planctomycetes bacterium]|nr:PQQ-binding-like beta-propeller repeat protein [Planctomycetota bacterium]